MKRNYILALDQGTTGSRAFLFDAQGRAVASDYKEFPQYFPKPGWVEHDAEEIWASCVAVIKGVLRKSHVSPRQIAAIGITNQRETTVLWDRKTGKPVHRAIVWQCRRTADICRGMACHAPTFRRETGLVLDPYFSGTKIRWLLDHVPGLRRRAEKGQICFGTIDSWLIWQLTAGQSHATDVTNASRTLIFNIRTLTWDKELLKILKIPSAILPRVQNSGSIFGYTSKAGTGRGLSLPPRTGLLRTGNNKKYLWDRLFYYVEYRQKVYCFQRRAAFHDSERHEWPASLCAGRFDFYRRRCCPMAAGPIKSD